MQTMPHIDFPILFSEAFFWAMLMGLAGTRRWLAAGLTMLIVSAIYLGPLGVDLYLVGTRESQGWLAFLSIGVVVPSLILASIGSSVGGLLGAWLTGLLRPEEEELIPEADKRQ